MNAADLLIPFLARLLIVVLFPFSALEKIIFWRSAMAQTATGLLPVGPALGRPLMLAAIAVELVTPVCIVLGWHDRPAAAVLAIFCLVTGVLYHPFWRCGDFWAPDKSEGRTHFWDFLKNLAIVGALLLMAVAQPLPWSTVMQAPWGSAPYTAPAP
ncbi:DoxX family protein [Roseomonas elaeocarpi]|uniref:DoxX family protein n=1 Tax=Roseomonas elaeocarpi TaxID=907779 RepID=A0ABV6JPL3_9PROT